jgi:hypothetical protein
MSGIIVCVKSDKIALQDTQQKLFSDRKDSIDFAAREGRVEEEANLDVLFGRANFLSQHCGQKHEMVVMHPNEISILYILCHCLSKQTIDFLICFP